MQKISLIAENKGPVSTVPKRLILEENKGPVPILSFRTLGQDAKHNNRLLLVWC